MSTKILWEGPSRLTGEPIVVLVSGIYRPSANPKTGPMVQTWVLHQDHLPTEALKSGADEAVCGSCPLRNGVCYVRMGTVNNIWTSYKEDRLEKLDSADLIYVKKRRLALRITAYGDALATPYDAWQELIKAANGHTGYTHQWLEPDIDLRWKEYLMASVHSEEEANQAQALGWRTFRVIIEGEQPTKNEIYCPNYFNNTNKCDTCQLCNGAKNSSKSIVNPVHGFSPKVRKFYALKENYTIGSDPLPVTQQEWVEISSLNVQFFTIPGLQLISRD